ncbi:MAG TPA: hypothetical protein ENO21_00940, partial [Firmicutes bacterium]|nr:hypothetical protein [Bacillota bacterium]
MAIQPTATGPAAAVRCPRCHQPVEIGEYACPECGFPMVCDLTPVDSPRLRLRGASWRVLLGVAALLFWLVNAVFIYSGSGAYHGDTTVVVSTLTPDTDSGIEISGPEMFVLRTQLALGLLELRAPD